MDAAVPLEDPDAAAAGEETLTAPRVVDDRAAAFARLFEAVHEGVYIGLVDTATTTTLAANPHLKQRNLEFRARHAGLSEEALEPLYYREALGFIAADPLWWLGLEARKFWYTWMPFGPSYRLHSPLYFWASALSLLFVLPLAVIGLVQAPVGTRPAALLALAASSVLVGLVFFPQERFRLPVLDPALLASASLMAARRGEPAR